MNAEEEPIQKKMKKLKRSLRAWQMIACALFGLVMGLAFVLN
jgi:hypothetical protein